MSTVFCQCISVEDVLESIERVEESIQESISREEGHIFGLAFVGRVDGGVKNKGELSEVKNNTFECTQKNSLVHNLGKGMTEGSRLGESSFECGIGLEGSDEPVKSYDIISVTVKKQSWYVILDKSCESWFFNSSQNFLIPVNIFENTWIIPISCLLYRLY